MIKEIRFRLAWLKWLMGWPGYRVTGKLDPATRAIIKARYATKEPTRK